MKWFAVFFVLVGDAPPIPVVDSDGPFTFETVEECDAHLKDALPRLNEIVAVHAQHVDTLLMGFCGQQGE